MIFFRRIRYATEMTIKTYMQSDKDLFKKGNTPKDYLELFIEFYKNCEWEERSLAWTQDNANNMETLLKPGDMIRIRDDIKTSTPYKMLNDDSTRNSWLDEDMLPAGTLVKIVDISSNQYIVHSIDKVAKSFSNMDDEFWLYTDEMFDPEMIKLLLD